MNKILISLCFALITALLFPNISDAIPSVTINRSESGGNGYWWIPWNAGFYEVHASLEYDSLGNKFITIKCSKKGTQESPIYMGKSSSNTQGDCLMIYKQKTKGNFVDFEDMAINLAYEDIFAQVATAFGNGEVAFGGSENKIMINEAEPEDSNEYLITYIWEGNLETSDIKITITPVVQE